MDARTEVAVEGRRRAPAAAAAVRPQAAAAAAAAATLTSTLLTDSTGQLKPSRPRTARLPRRARRRKQWEKCIKVAEEVRPMVSDDTSEQYSVIVAAARARPPSSRMMRRSLPRGLAGKVVRRRHLRQILLPLPPRLPPLLLLPPLEEGAVEADGPVEADGSVGAVEADGPVAADGSVEADGPVGADGPVEADGAVEADGVVVVQATGFATTFGWTFSLFDRCSQLGLKLALISPRFNSLVDKHFDGKSESTQQLINNFKEAIVSTKGVPNECKKSAENESRAQRKKNRGQLRLANCVSPTASGQLRLSQLRLGANCV
ncbi:hypothetical protein niasHS_004407 [Heterodera schachtii]|uniref:Uncharacterized protein n=1 Tax=Heterodera schachtii TaxID=97005 RepID=A0ABD2JKW8_HETSC